MNGPVITVHIGTYSTGRFMLWTCMVIAGVSPFQLAEMSVRQVGMYEDWSLKMNCQQGKESIPRQLVGSYSVLTSVTGTLGSLSHSYGQSRYLPTYLSHPVSILFYWCSVVGLVTYLTINQETRKHANARQITVSGYYSIGNIQKPPTYHGTIFN